MCGYVDGHLSQNGYRFALRDGPRIEEPLDNPPADGQSHLPPPPPSPGGAGLSLLHRELLPVNCTESYSRSATPRATRSATPRATPGQLHRELLPVCYTESFSRSATPRATPGLLHRELLPVCYTESYSRSAMLRKQRHIQGPTIMQTATTSNIMQRNKRTLRTGMAPTSLCSVSCRIGLHTVNFWK